jgi:solute carrier family 25 carnitine/acylcarnitine transporter 20/29
MGLYLSSGYGFCCPSAHVQSTKPLSIDAIKTRVQTWDLISSPQTSQLHHGAQSLLPSQNAAVSATIAGKRPSTYRIARDAYMAEGIGVFFKGLGICSARAFVVNAVQWAVSA